MCQTTKYLLRHFQLISTRLSVTRERVEAEESKTFLILKIYNVIDWKGPELSTTLLLPL